jgi:hypothetical protein
LLRYAYLPLLVFRAEREFVLLLLYLAERFLRTGKFE